MKNCSRLCMTLLATLISGIAAAQTSPAPPAPDGMPKAADMEKPARTTAYRSVFDNYVYANDDKPISWRDANALVKEIGGWRVYARESQQPTPANTIAPAGRPAPHQKH